jgi:hypothetical protein
VLGHGWGIGVASVGRHGVMLLHDRCVTSCVWVDVPKPDQVGRPARSVVRPSRDAVAGHRQRTRATCHMVSIWIVVSTAECTVAVRGGMVPRWAALLQLPICANKHIHGRVVVVVVATVGTTNHAG